MSARADDLREALGFLPQAGDTVESEVGDPTTTPMGAAVIEAVDWLDRAGVDLRGIEAGLIDLALAVQAGGPGAVRSIILRQAPTPGKVCGMLRVGVRAGSSAADRLLHFKGDGLVDFLVEVQPDDQPPQAPPPAPSQRMPIPQRARRIDGNTDGRGRPIRLPRWQTNLIHVCAVVLDDGEFIAAIEQPHPNGFSVIGAAVPPGAEVSMLSEFPEHAHAVLGVFATRAEARQAGEDFLRRCIRDGVDWDRERCECQEVATRRVS